MKTVPRLFLGAEFNKEYETKLNKLEEAIKTMAPEDSISTLKHQLINQIRTSVHQAYKLGLKEGEKRNGS